MGKEFTKSDLFDDIQVLAKWFPERAVEINKSVNFMYTSNNCNYSKKDIEDTFKSMMFDFTLIPFKDFVKEVITKDGLTEEFKNILKEHVDDENLISLLDLTDNNTKNREEKMGNLSAKAVSFKSTDIKRIPRAITYLELKNKIANFSEKQTEDNLVQSILIICNVAPSRIVSSNALTETLSSVIGDMPDEDKKDMNEDINKLLFKVDLIPMSTIIEAMPHGTDTLEQFAKEDPSAASILDDINSKKLDVRFDKDKLFKCLEDMKNNLPKSLSDVHFPNPATLKDLADKIKDLKLK